MNPPPARVDRACRHRACGMLLLLAGCTGSSSRPITIADALAELQSQLRQAGTVSASTADPAAFDRAARAAQCEAISADPEVPLLAGDITVNLTGSFSATGGFSVGNAVAGSGITATATRGQTQQLTLPLTFVSLSGLPEAVAAARLAAIAPLPQTARNREAMRIEAQRAALAARIASLVAGWNPDLCHQAVAPGRPAAAD